MFATVIRLLRAAARETRDLPDRLGHAGRRARTSRQVREAKPTSVVFICHGNICRSPYAAERLRARLRDGGVDRVHVDSAGVVGPADRSSPDAAIAAARRRGLDLRPHRSAKFADPPHRADLIVVMERHHHDQLLHALEPAADTPLIIALGDLDPEPLRIQAIRDPYGRPDRVFDACFKRIDRCIEQLTVLITADNGMHHAAQKT